MSFKNINNYCAKSKRCFAKETEVEKNNKTKNLLSEDRYYGDSRSIEAFIKSKIKMLRKDMYIEPTKEELDKLWSLKSMVAVDNVVHSIIDRPWASF